METNIQFSTNVIEDTREKVTSVQCKLFSSVDKYKTFSKSDLLVIISSKLTCKFYSTVLSLINIFIASGKQI